MAKPMKRANGTGSIYKVSGSRRRKPYQVMITAGWDDKAEIYEPKINRILGHTGKTTAENVYTHLDIQDLIEAINKI